MKDGLTMKQLIQIAAFNIILTAGLNFVFQWLKMKFEWFDTTKKFRREHYYKQLTELYLRLYAIVCQSEYLRYFHNIEKDFDKIPFLEIESKRYEQTFNLINGEVEKKKFDIADAITEFNKKTIENIIIENSKYASQEILKLAVAYRYVHQHYLDKTISEELLNKFQLEELKLINLIVKAIVKETNEKLKVCNMAYNKLEFKTGCTDDKIFRSL